jgi:hypothetical protein
MIGVCRVDAMFRALKESLGKLGCALFRPTVAG